jgi:hypothetical protein
VHISTHQRKVAPIPSQTFNLASAKVFALQHGRPSNFSLSDQRHTLLHFTDQLPLFGLQSDSAAIPLPKSVPRF